MASNSLLSTFCKTIQSHVRVGGYSIPCQVTGVDESLFCVVQYDNLSSDQSKSNPINVMC
jgi:hypothetical protein